MPRVSNASAADAAPPAEVIEAFAVDPASLRRASTGLINQTWIAERRGERYVLQRVNPVFPAQINYDIDVVTRHLHAKGLETPLLVPTLRGDLWHAHAGEVWRALTYVDGVSHEALHTSAQAREAGRVLAMFHRALADLDHEFRNARLGVHDTAKHLAVLRAALTEHAAHPEHARIAALAADVLHLAQEIELPADAPDRIVHGDPKISNIMFRGPRAVCLIDLDTLARMPVEFELGDAFRSWCNPKTEDASSATFVVSLFAAAVSGYGEHSAGMLTAAERDAIPAAVFRIAVELAARFCTDALHERYFAWDERRYRSASAHNQARTAGQLNLARSIRAQRADIEAVVRRAFRP